MARNEKIIDDLIKTIESLERRTSQAEKQLKGKGFDNDVMSLVTKDKKLFDNDKEREEYSKKIIEQEEEIYKKQEELNEATLDNLAKQFKQTENIATKVEETTKGMGFLGRIKGMFASISESKQVVQEESKAQEAKQVEKQEATRQDDLQFQASNIALLTSIEDHLRPTKEMIKGDDLKIPDFLKKLLPTGGMKGIGRSFMKLAGGALILGGVAWMLSDFIEGFQEGGIKTGLTKALLGKLDGTMMSAFKNAGKYALIGGGAGLMIAGPVGGIAGAMIGGSIGLLANTIGSLFVAKGDLGSKLQSFFLGSDGGVLASLFQGAKYAAMGALVGTAVAPGIGTIVGGVAGFAIGFLINFVKQLLPINIKQGISRVFKKIGDGLTSAWNWVTEKVNNLIEGSVSIFDSAVEGIKGIFNSIGDGLNWVADKLGVREYWEKSKAMISGAWDSFKSSITGIVDEIANIGKRMFDTFMDSIGGLWSKVKKWATFGDSKDEPTAPTKSTGGIFSKVKSYITPEKGVVEPVKLPEATSKAEVVSQEQRKIAMEKQTVLIQKTGMLESIANQMLLHIKSMEMFFKNDMVDNIKTVFVESLDTLYQNLRLMNEENRQFEYFMETGGMEGYGGRYEEFANQIKELFEDRQETGAVLNSMSSVVNDNKSNITTVYNLEPPKKLRN